MNKGDAERQILFFSLSDEIKEMQKNQSDQLIFLLIPLQLMIASLV
jgi:hypothetical protein